MRTTGRSSERLPANEALPLLHAQLDLPRCPYCRIDQPNLSLLNKFPTYNHSRTAVRHWGIYQCARCGGVVTAAAPTDSGEVREVYPTTTAVDEALPERARTFLTQATDSVHAPSGAVMLAASAVDAMLKAKDYKAGSLYSRIEKAAADHVITGEMAAWAHDVRLDANDERHADENVGLPSEDDARRVIDFAVALGQFLFVLPARVERGRAATGRS